MTLIYCKGNHQSKGTLCEACRNFIDYAKVRLNKCPFGEEKEACSKCPVHCYAKEQREISRLIMRYSGPKMLWRHPILSLYHFLDR